MGKPITRRKRTWAKLPDGIVLTWANLLRKYAISHKKGQSAHREWYAATATNPSLPKVEEVYSHDVVVSNISKSDVCLSGILDGIHDSREMAVGAPDNKKVFVWLEKPEGNFLNLVMHKDLSTQTVARVYADWIEEAQNDFLLKFVSKKFQDKRTKRGQLSDKERELIASSDLSIKEIANAIGCSIPTVKKYRSMSKIFTKKQRVGI